MRRLTLSFFAAVIASAAAVVAAAASTVPAPLAHVTGVIASSDRYTLTIQTPGKPTGVLNALSSAATRVQAADYPYVWGGGHGEAGIASVGEAGGSGYNGKRRGYDCSGAVAAVLAGAGLWPAGASVPNDAGVIAYLKQVGLIQPGAGTGTQAVTLYDEPGVHIFMSIDGRFFGTSDGGSGGDRRGGPGWLDVGPDVTSSAFKRYHVVPRALAATTKAGYTIGFEPGSGLGLIEYPTGTNVTVTYRTTASGMLVAQTVTPIGEITTAGTVQSVGLNGSTLTIVDSTGTPTTFDVQAGSLLAQQLADGQVVVGDTVSVGYLGTAPAALNLIALTVTSAAPPTAPPTNTSTTPTTTVPTQTTVTATTPTTAAPVPQT